MRILPNDIDIFADRLADLMYDRKVTATDLEEAGVVVKSTLYKIIRKVHAPHTLTVARLATYFDVSADWLLGLSNIKKPSVPRWIFEDGECICSNCGGSGMGHYHYCPTCGKEMDVEA